MKTKRVHKGLDEGKQNKINEKSKAEEPKEALKLSSSAVSYD